MPAIRTGRQDLRIIDAIRAACVSQVLRHPALAAELMGGVAVAAVNEIVSAGEGRGSDDCRRGERPLTAIACSFRGCHKRSVGVFCSSGETGKGRVDSETVVILAIHIAFRRCVVGAGRNLVLETFRGDGHIVGVGDVGEEGGFVLRNQVGTATGHRGSLGGSGATGGVTAASLFADATDRKSVVIDPAVTIQCIINLTSDTVISNRNTIGSHACRRYEQGERIAICILPRHSIRSPIITIVEIY